jgi:uncharacterized membrane protein YhiD involved in acid resistance
MPQQLNLPPDSSLSISMLLVSLGIGTVLALIVRWHFNRFGSTLANRTEFGHVLPFILLTTVLIIAVVKSSLALSLGLVGALSIVRFRTPIKEPEELAYLFIAIAIGLGLGAGRILVTVVTSLGILTVMGVLKWARREENGKNLFLSVDWQMEAGRDGGQCLERLNESVSEFTVSCDLRRFDIRDKTLEATYFVDASSPESLSRLVGELRSSYPRIGITFLDQSRLPSP